MTPTFFGRAALSATVFLAACAANPAATPSTAAASTQAAAGSPDEMFCTREYPIGSNIPVSRCRTRAQMEAEKAAATEAMRRAQTGGPNAKLGGGG